MLGCNLLDFHEGGDGREAATERLGSREALAVGHEAGAHGHHGLAFISVAIAADGEAAMAHDELPAFGDGNGRQLLPGLQVVPRLSKDPGIVHGRATDHDP